MDSYLEMQGTITRGSVVELCARIWHRKMNCLLQLNGRYRSLIRVQGDRVLYARTDHPRFDLRSYLVKKGRLDPRLLEEKGLSESCQGIEFRRMLIAEGFFPYRELWELMTQNNRDILDYLLTLQEGTYRIVSDPSPEETVPLMEENFPKLIRRVIQDRLGDQELKAPFQSMEKIYITRGKNLKVLDLHPYERHTLRLLEKTPSVRDLVRQSELLPLDTYRLLYQLWLFGVISPQREATSPRAASPTPQGMEFKDFEEVLETYNRRYLFIYKYLYKEIGPVAYSVLSKAVLQVRDQLPSYLHRLKMTKEGGINRETLIKDIWYHNFHDIIRDLVSGLEEVLHAQLHVVQQHVGEIRESRILEWIEK